MGNHIMEHRRTQVNAASPIMLEVAIVKTWRRHVRVGVI
jgi:hypothetical protein